jgi:hypothetical protein
MEKVVSIKKLKGKDNSFSYWQTKTDQERLEAIELLRQQFIQFNYPDVKPGFQRVCTVAKQK